MFEADAEQLHKIWRTEPDRKPALVQWPVAQVADPQAQHAQSVLVGIQRAQRLAKRLAQTIARIRPHRQLGADTLDARIEADGVVR